MPLPEIIGRAHGVGAAVLVDAAQAMRHAVTDVRALDCDMLVFSGHKLGSLTGIGVLYGKKALLDTFPPASFGGGMVKDSTAEPVEYMDAPARFEAGTPNYVGAVSLKAALDYLTALGRGEIAAYEGRYLRELEALLRSFPALRVLGAPARRAGAVSVTVSGASAYDLGVLLDSLGVAVRTGQLCAGPLMKRLGIAGAVRFSPAFYNTPEDLSRLEDALRRCLPLLKRASRP